MSDLSGSSLPGKVGERTAVDWEGVGPAPEATPPTTPCPILSAGSHRCMGKQQAVRYRKSKYTVYLKGFPKCVLS